MNDPTLDYLRREIEAVFFASGDNPIRAGEQALALLSGSEMADYEKIFTYFLDLPPSGPGVVTLWKTVLEYRGMLREQFGDRVSLHITFYHFTRDPRASGKTELQKGSKCTSRAQRIAFLEMRGWWEHNSQTGLHRPEILETRLGQEMRAAREISAPTTFLIVRLEGFKTLEGVEILPEQHEKAVLSVQQQLSAVVLNSCRSYDVVGHHKKDDLGLILPGTDIKGAGVVALRLAHRFKTEKTSCLFHFRFAIARGPRDAAGPAELIWAVEDALRRRPINSSDILYFPREPAGSMMRKFKYGCLRPARRFFQRPMGLGLLCVLILALYWIVTNRESIYNVEKPWNVLAELKVDSGGDFPEWSVRGADGAKPLHKDHFLVYRERFLHLVADGRETVFLDKEFVRPLRLHFSAHLPKGANLEIKFFRTSGALALKIQLGDFGIQVFQNDLCIHAEGVEIGGKWTDHFFEISHREVLYKIGDGIQGHVDLVDHVWQKPCVRMELLNSGRERAVISDLRIEEQGDRTGVKDNHPAVMEKLFEIRRHVEDENLTPLAQACAKFDEKQKRWLGPLIGDSLTEKWKREYFNPNHFDFLLELGGEAWHRPLTTALLSVIIQMPERERVQVLDKYLRLLDGNFLESRKGLELLAASVRDVERLHHRLENVQEISLYRLAVLLSHKLAVAGDPKLAEAWERLFEEIGALPLDMAQQWSRKYNAGVRADDREKYPHFEKALDWSLRTWQEEPVQCLREIRNFFKSVPAGEGLELLRKIVSRLDHSLVGNFLIYEKVMIYEDFRGRAFFNQIQKYVENQAVLVPEMMQFQFEVLHSCEDHDAARNVLKRLSLWSEPEIRTWVQEAQSP